MRSDGLSRDEADVTSDDYPERVLRNEGWLQGLEKLFAETRDSDRRLIEQRSESLARELERRAAAMLELVTARADAVRDLSNEERQSDRREVGIIYKEAEKRAQVSFDSLREVYATAIKSNYDQSRDAINALEQRREAATDKIEQMVRQWRDSDREARELFSKELDKHLDVLNHNNERMRDFQNHSVTRELWSAEKEAAIQREKVLRDQIIALDKTMLTMTPVNVLNKAHDEITDRMESTVAAASKVLDNKIGVVADKVEDLKTYQATTKGRSSGYSAVYAWIGAGFAIIVAIIFIANFLSSRT